MYKTEVVPQYQNYFKIFTDGSKFQDGRVAYCAYFPDLLNKPILSARIPDNASIFTAETMAILKSLDFIQISQRRDRRFIIFCDSKSVLETISNQETKNPLMIKLLDKLQDLKNSNIIKFCWIPSHVGIHGNNVADAGAKAACNSPDISEIKIPFTDFLPKVRIYVKNLWINRFTSLHNNARSIKLYEINPSIKPFCLNGLTRKDEVILHRVRIGHTRFTHSYVMEGGDINFPPLCYYCSNFRLTVKHLLIECTHFFVSRSRYFNGARDMGDLFQRFSHKHILSFLKETHLYEQF